jgi:hypothetical protein
MKQLLRSCGMLILSVPMGAGYAQITVDPIAPVAVCGALTINVAYTAPGGFDAGNVFSVELSDATGAFATPAVIGSVPGTGSGVIPCTFPVGIGGGGWAIRVVASDPPLAGDAYALPIQTVPPPNAGTNANIAVCSNGPPFSMFTLLGGSPEAGGAWTGPNGDVMSGIFMPGTSVPGCHTYTVAGLPPCANETAVLCITVSNAPDAGTNINFTACGGPPIDMQAGLPPGGTWTFAGAPHSNIFVPGVDPPGQYLYTLPGIPPCDGVTHTAWMMVDMPPDAGTSATLAWCQSWGTLDLFAQLGGTPDAGGTWNDLAGTGQLTGSNWDPTGMPNGSYQFTYTVEATGCPAATATVTVNHAQACLAPPPTNYVTY